MVPDDATYPTPLADRLTNLPRGFMISIVAIDYIRAGRFPSARKNVVTLWTKASLHRARFADNGYVLRAPEELLAET